MEDQQQVNQAQPEVAQPTVKNQNAHKQAMKKIALFLGVLGIIGISYGAYWGLYASNFEETEDAYVSAVQNSITSQVTGNVIEVNIQDGQIVKAGSVAIVLDKTDANLELEKAKADLASAVRSYGSLKYSKNQNQDSLNSKLSDLSKAQLDFNRDSASFQAGVITRQQYDDTKYKLEQAKIAVSGAHVSYQNAQLQALSKNVYEHPDVQKAINEYRQAYIDYQRTQVKVPIDGTIARKSAYVGQKVTPNQVLFSIIDTHSEWVDANLKESQLKHLKPGQSVTLTSDVNGKEYQGRVSSVQAGSGSALSLLPAQNATGNWIKIVQRVPIRIDIDPNSLKNNGAVPIGTSMRIRIDTRTNNQVFDIQNQKTGVYEIDEKQFNEDVKKIINANL